MNFLDEKSATCLALLAKDPQNNQKLLKILRGPTLEIGKAIVHLSTGTALEFDKRFLSLAQTIIDWAKQTQSNAQKHQAEQRLAVK